MRHELLWREQMKALKKGRQHRWHPEIIQWCLQTFLSSQSKYEQMRNAGFLILPSPRTLKRHSSQIEVKEGICSAHMEVLAQKAKAQGLTRAQRQVMLVFDSMHVTVSHGVIVGMLNSNMLKKRNMYVELCVAALHWVIVCLHARLRGSVVFHCMTPSVTVLLQGDVCWSVGKNEIVGLCDSYDRVLLGGTTSKVSAVLGLASASSVHHVCCFPDGINVCLRLLCACMLLCVWY